MVDVFRKLFFLYFCVGLSSINICLAQEIERIQKVNNKSKINNVFFNHAYVFFDEDTYDAIKNSAFLKSEFCHCEEKAHASAEKYWTGFYMTGKNTYLELFNNKNKKRLQGIGNVGIGFSVDRKEEFEQIVEVFKQKFENNIKYEIFEKSIDNKLVPWFYYVEVTGPYSMMPQLDPWIMAYHTEYFKFKRIENSDENSITRQEYNKKCNAVPFDKNKLFKDVEEITLLLNDEVKRKFIERQTLLGYICEEFEGYTICRGPGVIFKLELSPDQTCKLVKLCMSLSRKVSIQVHTLGNSMLELENETAVWTFK